MVFDANNGRFGLGTSSPATSIHFLHSSGGPSLGDGFTIENEGANNNRWNMYVQNGSGELWLYKNELYRGRFDDISGAYTSTSDRRLKKDFEPLKDVLPGVLELPIYKYRYKQEKNTAPQQVGLVAQDLLKDFSSLVDYNEEEDVYTLDYARVSVIAIKAIQEQQKQIEELKTKIELLSK